MQKFSEKMKDSQQPSNTNRADMKANVQHSAVLLSDTESITYLIPPQIHSVSMHMCALVSAPWTDCSITAHPAYRTLSHANVQHSVPLYALWVAHIYLS